MAELHSVDIETVDEAWLPSEDDGFESGLGLKETIHSWLPIARKLLELPAVDNSYERYPDLDAFEHRWERYMEWMSDFEKREGRSRRVLSHNDVRRRNILRLTKPDERILDHHQVIFLFPFFYSLIQWGPLRLH
jgi:choline kinase